MKDKKRSGCVLVGEVQFKVGDTAVFNPFAVDNPEYWDDYSKWKKELVRIEEIERSGHPFLHIKVRSVGRPALVDWVDESWLSRAEEEAE